MMIRAEVSSGRSDFAISSPSKDESPDRPPAATVSTGAEPPSPAAANAAVRTVMTFFGVRRLHRLDGVAGIDRPLEGVGPTSPW